MSKSILSCQYFPRCSGCSYWDLSYQQQQDIKKQQLRDLLAGRNLEIPGEIEFISCGEHGLRHRMDFTLQYRDNTHSHEVGFYDHAKELIAVDRCLQLAPELQKIYSEFTKFSFFFSDTPVKKGSVRLRIGPQGLKGCWLDFSNLDIKHLLADQKFLRSLLEAGYWVEIGQKGKRLISLNESLKLADPVPQIWFQTGALPMLGLISDFTQPSWITGDALVNVVMAWASEIQNLNTVYEFGAGLGQFTLNFLKAKQSVKVFEISAQATTALRESSRLQNLDQNLSIEVGDFHRQRLSSQSPVDLVFLNPARSGLKNFVDEVISTKAENIIYVSCFPESMTDDLQAFKNKYKICNIKIIDQFPQTKHFETCVLLKKLS